MSYVATFRSSCILNKYSNREKNHLTSWNEGRDTSSWRGTALFPEFDMQLKGRPAPSIDRGMHEITETICTDCINHNTMWDEWYDLNSPTFRVS